MYAVKNVNGNEIAATAVIHPTVIMGTGCKIGQYAVIEANVILGNGVRVFPHAVIGRQTHTTGAMAIPPKAGRRDVNIADGASIGAGACIYTGTFIGKDAIIGDGAHIRENCFVGEMCIVGSNAGLSNNVRMHMKSRVLDFTSITAGTVIEEGAFIGVGVITQNDNSFNHGGEMEPPTFKRGCMVGGNSTILPGVVVGENARISAGSIVRKSVPPASLTWPQPSGTREAKVTNDDILDEWAEDTVRMLEKYYDSRA